MLGVDFCIGVFFTKKGPIKGNKELQWWSFFDDSQYGLSEKGAAMLDTMKSPLRTLVRFFMASRDRWKQKCLERRKVIKRLNRRVSYLETDKASLRQQVKALQSECVRLRSEVATEKSKKKRLLRRNCA
jgi:septal ring factor EnvC (AmiA/AmiB activator)